MNLEKQVRVKLKGLKGAGVGYRERAEEGGRERQKEGSRGREMKAWQSNATNGIK